MKPLTTTDPATLGRYTLLARLGTGGMGVVYLGRSSDDQLVAIKVIRDDHGADRDYRRRFAREAQTAQQVSGYFSASIVEAEARGEPLWVAQEYIPGPSLGEVVRKQGPLPPRSLHRLALGLADAVRSIHAVGLVHRGLTPGNVLLEADGPRVTGFGLARTERPEGVVRTGQIVGTPEYMSPEQANAELVSFPADVFALGSVLAFAATGRPPFGEGEPTAVLRRIMSNEPDLPGVSEPFCGVVAACLAKNPVERPTAEKVVSRVSAIGGDTSEWLPEWVRHEVASVQHTSMSFLSGGRSLQDRRRRWPLAAAAVSAALVLGVGTLAAVRYLPFEAASELAQADPGEQAQAPESIATTDLTADDLGDPGAVISDPAGRALSDVAFSSDGEQVAAVGPAALQFWRLNDQLLDEDMVLPVGDGAQAVDYSPDPQGPIEAYAAAGMSESGEVLLPSDQEDGILPAASEGIAITDVVFSPDGGRLATVDASDQVATWDMESLEQVTSMSAGEGNGGAGPRVSWAPDGSYLVTTGKEAPVLADPETGDAIETLPARDTVHGVAVSPDGTSIATTGADGAVELWDAETRARYATLSGGEDQVIQVDYSEDGALIATLDAGDSEESEAEEPKERPFPGETVRLWNAAEQEQIGTLDAGNDSAPLGLAFGPDDRLAVSYQNGDIALWDLS
ncbi:WD40 repeat domain-containing serine/threonine protein kinase [Allosalinactinospora lopnorensis]|uniref:WD40 repeat domain-containing serine/threonine protein kinase n=1 Tax=Allosalinactinospora lopnorensis TaxID=1352348 RepID=UPI00069746E4|nr:serine/threonine-protein kinase [Allosalinactinospora lopnorensis]